MSTGDLTDTYVLVQTWRGLSQKSCQEEGKIDGGYGWVVVFSCFWVQLVSVGMSYTSGVWLAEFTTQFDLNTVQSSFIVSLSSAVSNLAVPIGGVLASMFGARPAIIVGCLLAGLSLAVGSRAESPILLVMTYSLLSGSGLAFVFGPSISVAALYFSEQRKALALGVVMAGTALGPFAIPLLASSLIKIYSWRGCFLIMGGLLVQCCVFGALIIPVKNLSQNSDESLSTSVTKSAIIPTHILKDPVFIIQFISITLWYSACMSAWILLPDCVSKSGMHEEGELEILSYIGLGYAFGRSSASVVMVARPNTDRLMIHKACLSIAGIFFIGFALEKSFKVFCILAFGLGFGDGFGVSTLLLVTADLHGIRKLTITFSYLYAAAGIGTMFGPYLSGVLVELTSDYTVPFVTNAFLLTSSGLILNILPLKNKCEISSDEEKIKILG